MKHIKAGTLQKFVEDVLLILDFPAETAKIAAANLVKADMVGIDSHGVARLSGYVRLVKQGRINPYAQPKIIHETPSTATLDGDSGLGLWVANQAMNIAIEKAVKVGSGWVAVQNSSHFGIADAHASLAINKDMIGLAMTNASPLVAPAGSIEPYLGTNPICVAVPAGKYPPFIMDMATAAAANGKLEIAQRKQKDIPYGWVQSKDGSASKDPHELKSGGTLLPLGSTIEGSYHKGYGLGSVVDILTGVLSGANFGMWVPPFVSFLDVQKELVGNGIGHFVGAWRIDAFQPADAFKARMDKWIEGIKQLKTVEGVDEVLIPGEPEYREKLIREKEGVPIIDKVYEDLLKLQLDLGIKHKLEAMV